MERAFQTGLSPAQHLFAKITAKLSKTLGPFFERIQAKDFYCNETVCFKEENKTTQFRFKTSEDTILT